MFSRDAKIKKKKKNILYYNKLSADESYVFKTYFKCTKICMQILNFGTEC